MSTKDDEDALLRSTALQNAASILVARQRAEQRSEAYLAEAQRLSHTGSFGWKPSTGEIIWSDETFRIFQYDRATTPSIERVLHRVHPEDAALVQETIERAAQTGRDFDFEHRLLMPDRSVRHCHVVARASRDESGGLEFAGAVMDVTEHHQARAALERALGEITKSERQLQLIVDTIPTMVWGTRPDGEFDLSNRPTVEYFGQTTEDLRRQGYRHLLHPEEAAEILDKWSAALATGKPFEAEFRVRGADGAYRWFLCRAAPLRDEQGHIVRWYATGTDIEDRKRAEMLLAGEKRLLEMIARAEPLALILDALCRLVEELARGCQCSILLLDPKTRQLRHGAAPSLPAAYSNAIDGAVIGPAAGSCGTAAYRREPVVVADIATDPLWADYRDLALAHGLRACWSTPILSSKGEVLGTFATYYGEPRRPTVEEHSVIHRFAQIASIALEREQGEAALRQQAGLLDLTHDTVLVRDMHDVITYWNRGAEELYGWTRAEAVGEVIHRLLHTRFPEPLEAIMATLLRTRRWDGELVHKKRDGTSIVVASRWAVQPDDRGDPVTILETNTDVTERKRAEQALRQQADLLEQTHDAIIVWNFPGTIVYWNRAAQQLYGFTEEEAIGRLTHELLQTEHPIPTAAFEAMLARDRTWAGEVTHTTCDGRKVVIDSRHVLVEGADGGRFVLETNRDITDRKRAEYLTAQVFDSSPDAVAIVGRDYRYERVNPVLARYSERPAERIVGMHVRDFGAAIFERTSKPYFDRCFAGEEATYAGWVHGPGGRRYMAATWSPLRPHGERVEAALVISRDLTDHVLAADALREAQATLAHVARVTALGEVTASIAHEVNQPLAAIVNNAIACLGLLRDGRPDADELRDALCDIVSDGERASAIIERVRGLAKRSPLQYLAVQIPDVVGDVVALVTAESVARGVAIRTDVPGDLPAVLGDRVQLQQVLLNLLVNGMDAMNGVAEDTRVLEIRGCPDDQDESPAVRVSVRDRGVGLDPGQRERLFQAFYTTKPGGMGLGLAISRSIIDAHGGRLWAEANDGPGATFWFTVPAAARPAAS